MKTKLNMNNIKKVAATVCAALIMTAGSLTQANSGNCANKNLTSLISLESVMTLTEQSIRYIAPAVSETEAVSAEMENLEILAGVIEASIRYEAPSVEEADEVAPVLERLEMMAAATEIALKYEAPQVNDVEEVADEILLAMNN